MEEYSSKLPIYGVSMVYCAVYFLQKIRKKEEMKCINYQGTIIALNRMGKWSYRGINTCLMQKKDLKLYILLRLEELQHEKMA